MRAILLSLVLAVAAGPADVWAGQRTASTTAEAAALKQVAAAIPLGSRVKVETRAGYRVNGTLMSVTDDAVIIKKKTRLPEPAVSVPFADLERLELQLNEGMSPAKIIAIGLSAGAGAVLTLIAFAFAMSD